MSLRTCGKCGEEANTLGDLTSFKKNSASLYGRANLCMSCHRERDRELQATPLRKTMRKDAYLKKLYDISLDEYNLKFKEQEGCCAICGTHQAELTKTLCVDHDHDTEEVRSLLCGPCNMALGLFKDSVEVLTSALSYLKSHGK